jgi:hypothetical protein
MIIVIADVDEVAALLGLSTERHPTIIRPQTSGPCVHYDERSEHAADTDPCTYSYDDGRCPHLDNPEILCPVKDACSTMQEIARMRDACEAEQEEQVCSLCGYYDERSEHVDNIDPCTHPDACEGGCPYLDDDWIYCPQKDEWSAASKQAEEDLAWAWGDDIPKFVPLAQDPEGRGTDMVAEAPDQVPQSDYVLAPRDPQGSGGGAEVPEFPALEPDDGALHTYTVPATRKPTNPNAWSDEEIEVIRRAQSADEAGRLYSETYGIWKRSRSAVTSRWYKLRAAGELIAPAPTPDFAGDTVPVTQCDEAAIRRPRFKAGDRVRISHPTYKGYTGTIRRYHSATANYLTHIDGTTDTMWLSEEYLEAA